jgi:hypothetical protein
MDQYDDLEQLVDDYKDTFFRIFLANFCLWAFGVPLFYIVTVGNPNAANVFVSSLMILYFYKTKKDYLKYQRYLRDLIKEIDPNIDLDKV